jgi:hypothetical protein
MWGAHPTKEKLPATRLRKGGVMCCDEKTQI